MAEAKAAKHAAKQRERNRFRLQKEAERAREEVDSKLREDERNKMMEYYSKLNQEVEKSKIHTEWKIRRLQLDETRMQLLSTEERNLKREKLELEHKRNEEAMAMSIQSTCSAISEDENKESQLEQDFETKDATVIAEDTKVNAKPSSGVFSAICNAAKSIFGGKSEENVDNKKHLDAQGNVVPIDTDNNTAKYTLSSDVIGADLSDKNDNEEYLKMREEAIKNKLKVMTHEFGQTDADNNLKDPPVITSSLLAIDEENNVEKKLLPFLEAKRNKLKILGTDHDSNINLHANTPTEPITEAQKEALANKLKVLGVEYNLPIEASPRNDPANIAQEEALRNKEKILGSKSSESGSSSLETIHRKDPANIAQEEALRNREKILGSESSRGDLSISESYTKRDPANQAQEEAIRNRDKILGSETYDSKTSVEISVKKEPANIAQEEALRNRDKILGSDYDSTSHTTISKRDPANIAQEEAIRNRDKILGSQSDTIDSFAKKDPANIAQEEALSNRERMLGSESGRMYSVEKREVPKRSGLSLNLKPYDELLSGGSATTLGTGVLTPGGFLSPLDLETPTTADVPLGAMTSDVFTPHSETNKLETGEDKPDKPYLTSEGFDFSILVDENVEETIDGVKSSPESSPSKYTHSIKEKPSMINYFDDSYSLENLDPFGVKQLATFSKDYFSSRMDIPSTTSFYTHPSVIMEEVKKKPYQNMFSRLGPDDDEIKVDCDNIATLTACLQRSVMLPLTYQLEVVNNSILTYFMVNLDMYEHLRSLKDYFFLMDGEFSNSICQNLFTRLVKTLNPQELLNFATLHNILDKALGSSISHVHKFSENLSFTITESPLSFQHSSPDVLQCLSLTYTVNWPLNIILSQEALLRYAKVFQFLLKMRRIFWVLGEDFAHLKLSAKLSRSHSRRLMKSPQYISVQIYRHVMAAMIRALDNYIVTTCILSSWKEFENDLKKARTLDDLYDCHVVYVKKVLFRCLLNNRSTPVMKLLNDIFTVILKFSRVLKHGCLLNNRSTPVMKLLNDIFTVILKFSRVLKHECLLNNRSTPVMKLLNDIFTVILKFSRVLKHGEWQQKEPNGAFTHSSFIQLQELFHLFEKLAKYLHRVITKLMECGYQRHLAELLVMVNLNGQELTRSLLKTRQVGGAYRDDHTAAPAWRSSNDCTAHSQRGCSQIYASAHALAKRVSPL
ncbi:spc97 / spc98 family domain-containing protein [Phthorimaea operculella]|nr:spc97 / spc98 family domain-containing protein [Phthorimaea operculella]